MPRRTLKLPSYRLHRNSGQVVVTLKGRDHYLGRHGTEESRQAYERIIAQWLASHGQLPAKPTQPRLSIANQAADPESAAVSIDALFVAYWDFAKTYYVKNGRPTSSLSNINAAYRFVHELYGDTHPEGFAPLALKAVRQRMIDAGLSRTTINDYVDDIRRLFKWATENEFVNPSLHHGLRAVSGLSKARYAAIDATLRQATLLLPNPTVLWARLDSQQSKVHRLSRQGLWFMMIGDAGESELMELAWRESEQGFAKRAADPTLIKQAQDQAVVTLQQLFAHNGWSVKVVWQ